MKGPKVVIYTKSSSPYCHMLKDWLRRYSIEYEEKNVEFDREAEIELLKKSGQLDVPVIDIDGIIIIGFDVEKIKEVLKID